MFRHPERTVQIPYFLRVHLVKGLLDPPTDPFRRGCSYPRIGVSGLLEQVLKRREFWTGVRLILQLLLLFL
jgi:hypothetical protein